MGTWGFDAGWTAMSGSSCWLSAPSAFDTVSFCLATMMRRRKSYLKLDQAMNQGRELFFQRSDQSHVTGNIIFFFAFQ